MTKTGRTQGNLFKKEIPQMQEGYYSSGPNPNLVKFVKEHATPYDPTTDDYDVPPFDKPIKTTKATAIYNMHTYWSKKPHDAIQEYIKHFTQPGDLVLDPFCGSGGTALAALMEGRKAIAIDLSPAATFITKNYCTPVDLDELGYAYDKLEAVIKPEMDWLYETRCDRCDGRAKISYTVYSQVFQCSRCLEKVPLFDCPDLKVKTKNGKSKTIRVCPFCLEKNVREEIDTSGKKYGTVPVLVSYLCEDGCKPKRDHRKHNDGNLKKSSYFQKYDVGKIKEIEKIQIPYWCPKDRMMDSKEETKRWGELWRAGIHKDITQVNHFFTNRNLWALALLKNKIDNMKNEDLEFVFGSNILSATLMQQYRKAGGGFAKGTYYIPPIFIEREQQGCFSRKFSDVLRGKKEINNVKTTSIIISTNSAVNLPEINSNSIDYIFTDPPYSGTVQYGELNFLWEKWMGFQTDWHDQEIIVNDTRGKTENDWVEMMLMAMEECYRVLKPGRWLTLCYHDTSEGTWQLVQDIMAEIGFISDVMDQTLFIDAGQKSYNQLTAQKVTKRDLVINFRKPRPGEIHAAIAITGEEDERTFTQKARAILTEALEHSPGSTADRLYDELVSRMVRKGEFERHNYDTLLRSVAEEVSTPDEKGNTLSRWYLLETTGEEDAAENRKEEAVASRLEDFMVEFLSDHPEFEGVHYSDLFEQYLPVGDKPRRMLVDWLPEFFYRTSEGTWRPPMDGDERQQKQHLRTNGTLRRIKRFTNAILNSVPPAGRDRPENAATLANWINECRKAGLYNQGKLLYEQGGHSFDALSEKAQLEVRENYLICRRRLGKDDDKQMSLL